MGTPWTFPKGVKPTGEVQLRGKFIVREGDLMAERLLTPTWMTCEVARAVGQRWREIGGKKGLSRVPYRVFYVRRRIDEAFPLPATKETLARCRRKAKEIGYAIADEMHAKGARRFVRWVTPPLPVCTEARSKALRVAVLCDHSYTDHTEFIARGR